MRAYSSLRNTALESLLDERDDLNIQIRLASGSGNADFKDVTSKIEKLAQLNSRIGRMWQF